MLTTQNDQRPVISMAFYPLLTISQYRRVHTGVSGRL